MKTILVTSGSSWATGEEECSSVKDAVRCFENNADEIGRFGDIRSAEGLIYWAGDMDYPIWSLSIGPRGGVRKEAC